MKIFGKNEKLNYPTHLEALFQAMENGYLIKSITCMAGASNKDDRSKDFIVRNFVASSYWVSFQQNYDGSQKYDYVDGVDESENRAFYMNWVLSFEL